MSDVYLRKETDGAIAARNRGRITKRACTTPIGLKLKHHAEPTSNYHTSSSVNKGSVPLEKKEPVPERKLTKFFNLFSERYRARLQR
jgi:hypothetical protein